MPSRVSGWQLAREIYRKGEQREKLHNEEGGCEKPELDRYHFLLGTERAAGLIR